jgi:hypothetical protein
MERLLNIGQVSRVLNLSTRKVYDLAERGRIPTFKIDGAWRASPRALQAFIDAGGKLNEQDEGERPTV